MDEERKLNKLGKHNDGRSKLPEYKIWKRFYRGWDIVKAITIPAGRYYGKGKAKR